MLGISLNLIEMMFKLVVHFEKIFSELPSYSEDQMPTIFQFQNGYPPNFGSKLYSKDCQELREIEKSTRDPQSFL